MKNMSDDQEKEHKSRFKLKRLIIIVAAVLILFLATLTAFAPAILSSSLGRSFLEGVVNRSISGSLMIESISFSWAGVQSFRGLTVRDSEGEKVLHLGNAENNQGLWKLLTSRGKSLGVTEIKGLEVNIVTDEEGKTNLQKAFVSSRPPGEKKKEGPFFFPLGSFRLADAVITVSAPGIETVEFSDLRFDFDFPETTHPAKLNFFTRSKQGELSGDLKAEGIIENLLASDGSLQLHEGRADFTLSAGGLPVAGIDHALGFKGFLTAALGKNLDLKARALSIPDGLDISFKADSPNLVAEAKVRLGDGKIKLTEEAEADMLVTAALISKLAGSTEILKGLKLLRNVPLNLGISQFSFPAGSFDPALTAMKVQLTAGGDIDLIDETMVGEIKIAGLEAYFDSPSLADTIGILLSADFHQAGKKGIVRVDGQVRNLFSAEKVVQTDRAQTDLKLEIKGAPTALFDRILRGKGFLVETIGPQTTLVLTSSSAGEGRADVDLSLEGSRLKGNLSLEASDNIALTSPAQFKATFSPEVIRRLMGDISEADLRRPAEVVLRVDRFSLPRPKPGEPFFKPDKTSFQAAIESTPLDLTGLPRVGDVLVDGFKIELAADHLSEISGNISGDLKTTNKEFFLHQLTEGKPVRFQVDVATGLTDAGSFGPLEAVIGFDAPNLSVDGALNLKPPFDSIELPKGLTATLEASPSFLESVGIISAESALKPAHPVPLKLKIAETSFPVKDFSFSKMSLSADLQIEKLELAGGGEIEGAILKNALAALLFTGGQAVAGVTITGETSLAGKPGTSPFKVEAKLKELLRQDTFDLNRAKMEAQFDIKALPTAFLEAATGGSDMWQDLIGEQMDVSGKAVLKSLRPMTGLMEGKVASRQLSADFSADIAEMIVLNKPARFRWELTPVGYKAFMTSRLKKGGRKDKERKLFMVDETVVEGEIKKLRWPLGGRETEKKINLSKTEVAAHFTIPEMSFLEEKSQRKMVFKGVSLDTQSEDLTKELKFSAIGQALYTGATEGDRSPAGNFKTEAMLRDLFLRDGSFNKKGYSAEIVASGDSLPVTFLDELLYLDGLGLALFGERLNMKAAAHLEDMSGPLTVAIDSKQSQVSLEGNVADGILKLREPLTANLVVTEDLGRKLLYKFHPFFETIQTSDEPIKIEIPADGFSVPLRQFKIDDFLIPRIDIDAHQMILNKGGLLEFVVLLAKQSGALKGRFEGNSMEVWFTPLQAKVKEGVISYQARLDLLIDNAFHVITWGKITLPGPGATDKGVSFDLVLGIPQTMLARAFGIKKIGEGEIFTIPLKGHEGRIDYKGAFTKAAADLGRLRVQYQLVKKNPLAGMIAGEIFNQVLGQKSMAIPPQSVDPLPWQDLLESQSQPESQTESIAPETKEEKTSDDLIKDIFDLIK